MKIKIEPFPSGTAKHAGSWDRAGRWYPDDKYRVPGSFTGRSPTRAWPNSFVKHFYTKKYAKLLLSHRPDLYMYLHNIPKDSTDHNEIIALAVTKKLAPEMRL